jgi:hypothetical protein
MSETDHASDVPESAHPPLPIVHDEAGDTPAWLPISGLCAFLVLALFVLWRAGHPVEEPAPTLEPAPGVVVEAPDEAAAPPAH